MLIETKIIARASKCEVIPLGDNRFKIKLTRPAIEGKANEQLREILANHFKISKSSVVIISGQHNSIKRIEINTNE